MVHKFLLQAKKISPDLAKWYQEIAETSFYFKGEDPLEHSAHNHEHLWMQESYAHKNSQIDFTFRKQAIEYLFSKWKERLKGYYPYQEKGYRLYLYQDRQPTISVVAETPQGFPYKYSLSEALFVDTIDDVLVVFDCTTHKFDSKCDNLAILKTVEKFEGSIGKPTAQYLGMTTGELRKTIENKFLTKDVNRIRKKFKRTPAKFIDRDISSPKFPIYEERLLPGYD